MNVKEAYAGASSKPKNGRADSAVNYNSGNSNAWARRFSRDIEVGDTGEAVRRYSAHTYREIAKALDLGQGLLPAF